MRFVVAALLLPLIFSSVPVSAQGEAFPQALEAAQRALTDENYGRVISLLRAHDDESEARELLLRAYRRSFRFREGIAAVESWLSSSASPAVVVVEAALLLGEAGQVAAALQRLDAALEFDPKDAALRKTRARLRFAVGDCEGAAVDAKAALAAGDASSAVHYLCGAALSRLAKVDSAKIERHLQAAIELEDGHVLALFELGRLRVRQERVAEAVDLFRRVLYVDHSHAGALLQLGGALRRIGAHAEGAKALERFERQRSIAEREKDLTQQLRNNLGNLEALKELAYFSIEQEDYAKARWLLDEVRRVSGGDVDGRTSLAIAQVARSGGDLTTAFRALQRALTLDSSLTEARLEMAEVAIELTRYDIALKVLERCKGADDRRWLLCAGQVAEDLGERAEHLAAALELGAVEALDLFATNFARLRRGADRAKAAQELEKRTDSALAQLARARLALDSRNVERAKEAWEAAERLDPWLPELYLLAARWHDEEGRPAEAATARQRARELSILRSAAIDD